MSQNLGKVFEEQIKKYTPDGILVYRLGDAAQSFGGGSAGLRFSNKNPFDYMMWHPDRRTLFALELKTVSGKSISFERTKQDKGEIHYHQIRGLNEWNSYDGTICGFIIEFRQLETTVFLDINHFNRLVDSIPKKSFNMDDLNQNEVPYFVIPQEKLRTRYRYDMEKFFSEIHVSRI